MKVFITGGTTGIGFELAKRYLKEKAQVAVCGRSKENFERSCAQLEPYDKNNLAFYQVDITNREAVNNAVKDFAKGSIDIVVANAGISMANKSKMPNFDRAHKVMATNVMGVLNTFEVALELMLPRGQGQIVAISSVAGFAGLPGAAAYSSSKSAVITLCESFSIDLKAEGIDVSCICPGFIKTPLTDQNTHAMPFLMSVEKGVDKIKYAIDKRKELYVFPLPMALFIFVLYHLPRSVYRTICRLLDFDFTGGKKA